MANSKTKTASTKEAVFTNNTEKKEPVKKAAKSPVMKNETAKVETKSTAKRKSLSSFDQNELVELKSCFYGQLIYISRAGYSLTFPEFGAVELIPIKELITMRNEQPVFFRNGWVVPVSKNAQEIIDALQLTRYYKNISIFENFDDIFEMEIGDLISLIKNMAPAMKENVARRAFQLKNDGVIDSAKIIEAISEATGFSLDE